MVMSKSKRAKVSASSALSWRRAKLIAGLFQERLGRTFSSTLVRSALTELEPAQIAKIDAQKRFTDGGVMNLYAELERHLIRKMVPISADATTEYHAPEQLNVEGTETGRATAAAAAPAEDDILVEVWEHLQERDVLINKYGKPALEQATQTLRRLKLLQVLDNKEVTL